MQEKQLLSRQEWVNACRPHALSCSEVLEEIRKRVLQNGAVSIVLLDLDSTLYEVGPRTYQILCEWKATVEINAFPKVKRAFQNLNPSKIGYSLKDTFQNMELSLEDEEIYGALQVLKKYWEDRFFANQYLRYDRVYSGAVEFVKQLYMMGIYIVYLTGRDEPDMGEGTRQNLLKHGFPFGVSKTDLLLKSSSNVPDLEHKQNAAEIVKNKGELIASFENEPANLVAIYDLFPQAMHVFVDTSCSEHPARPCNGLYLLKNFAA
ncbi:MAG: HAD family hydrolase [Bdellovibrio sp.]|nr:HAD family hydrolase [Bdellovibrio sp.]